MTAQEMSAKILARVSTDPKGVGISVCEVMDACGAEAKGEYSLESQHNLLLWIGVSEVFVEAFNLARPQMDVVVLPPLLALTEPRLLTIPIAKQVHPYKTPRWLPVALFAKGAGRSAKARRGKKGR